MGEVQNFRKNAQFASFKKLVKQSGIATRTTHIGLSSDIEEGEIVSDEENCIDSQENKYIIQGILDVVKHERLHSFPTFSNVKCEAPELSSANIREKNGSVLFPCKNEYIEPDEIFEDKPIVKLEQQTCAYFIPCKTKNSD